jgi:shikimate dehydrogenase
MTLYGLIGYPLSHSFSPDYFNQKFSELGLEDHHYKAFEIRDLSKLRLLLNGQPDLRGFNVTIPYKREIVGYMHHLHHSAFMTGAVNVVKIKEGRLIGFNSDVYGLESSLLPLLKPEMKQALILGSGGSSQTAAFVLRSVGIKCQFVSRSKKNPYFLKYEELTADFIAQQDVIVNTTPVGMYPNSEHAPAIPFEGLHANQLCFDLIYNPEQTIFLQYASEKGARIQNGHDMLIAQAEKSWAFWQHNFV